MDLYHRRILERAIDKALLRLVNEPEKTYEPVQITACGSPLDLGGSCERIAMHKGPCRGMRGPLARIEIGA